MNGENELSVEQALAKLVEAAHALPGSFSADVALRYFAGVIDGKRWACEVEADVHGSSFTVWGESPQQAIELAIAEAWRRVPDGSNSDIDIPSEWFWRDAWLLASICLAGRGPNPDLADVLGATRLSSTPSVFMSRDEFAWATSRLIESGLVTEKDRVFVPTTAAFELWSVATTGRPTLGGAGFTRSLLPVLQTSEITAQGGVRSWALAETDYLQAIRQYVERTTGMATET